jgi:Zn-dependent alcohol dehydrogenase
MTDGRPIGQDCGLGTFAEHTTVNVSSVVKVPKDLCLERLCLLGCAVGTGWGSAVNHAAAGPGDTVIVMGVGGVGMNAVQGAAHAGASNVIAVDPIEFKRDVALTMGATAAFGHISEATEYAKKLTDWQGADSAIVTVGVLTGSHIAEAFNAVRKAGTVVVTALGDFSEVGIPIPPSEFVLYQKRIQGALFGGCNPLWDIPRQIELYRQGRIKIDELVTREYRLDEIATAYADMHAGRNIRGVVVYD